MFCGLLMESCVGVEGSFSVCPLPCPPPGPHIGTIQILPLPPRPLPGSQHSPLGLEANTWQQKIRLSPKSQGQMGTAGRSLCYEGHRCPCGLWLCQLKATFD